MVRGLVIAVVLIIRRALTVVLFGDGNNVEMGNELVGWSRRFGRDRATTIQGDWKKLEL